MFRPCPSRQTQNPERGRKLVRHLCLIQVQCPVVRPKTPRGDGNPRNRPTWACPQRVVRPKTPRGDGNTSHALPLARIIHRVVRPKTPRGDGNSKSSTTSAAAACSRSRQTQNPERGRKPGEQRRRQPGGHGSVVRPKTPRGDGNIRTSSRQRRKSPVVRPKTPRGDGNYTTRRAISQRPPRRQTQNPERGRKPPVDDSYVRVTSSQSSDPKPREGTET
ncbi:Uncharacterised protein [Mycobacterium tuberculosis]|nr:Uncharacterised protein [Mycobacterium tuberculosis]